MVRTSAILALSNLGGSDGFRIDGVSARSYAGQSVSAAGDVNGDGFDDIIVGARFANPNGQLRAGSSYVVFGGSGGFGSALGLSTLNGINGFRIDGISANDQSGYSVSAAGDINGDGFDDIIIGAVRATPDGQISTGASYVVFGRTGGFGSTLSLASLDGSNGFRIDGVSPYDYTGRSVSAAGDINGDGFDDIIVGASNADPGGRATAGSSYVVFGRLGGFGSVLGLASLDGSNGFRIDGASTFDGSGYTVASAGDVNGDGFDDVLISARRASPNGLRYAGSSYVVFGRSGGFGSALDLSTLNGNSGFRIDGASANDASGWSVSAAGDVNGDGVADILIGARNVSPNGLSRAGSAYVIYGRASGFGSALSLSGLDGSNGFRVVGVSAFDYSGVSVSSAGDVNGDGIADFIIGAAGADANGRSDAGSAYVVYGRPGGFGSTLDLSSINGINGFRIDGVSASDSAGFSVHAAGDLNSDGFADLVVGAPFASPNGNIFAGSSYVIYGAPSARGVRGDLNRDGTSDLVLQNGDTVIDWLMGSGQYRGGNVLTGNAGGYSVVGRGDVNGDGTTDLVLQNGDSIVAYIVGGGRYQSTTTITAGGAGGFSVRDVADVNGDGTADLILQNGGTVVDWILGNGRYQGGNIIATGATGFTVAGAGDFDGDGTADLVLQNGGTVALTFLRDGQYQSNQILTRGASGFTVVGTGDFDGDGTDDILLQNGSAVVDWIMRDGRYQGGNVLSTSAAGLSVRATGDYNSDGTSDVVLQAGTTQAVQWTIRNGLLASSNTIGNTVGFAIV